LPKNNKWKRFPSLLILFASISVHNQPYPIQGFTIIIYKKEANKATNTIKVTHHHHTIIIVVVVVVVIIEEAIVIKYFHKTDPSIKNSG
jgi:hypothetical protein